jgi:hypothetical protein
MTPTNSKPVKPVAKGGQPLPPGARGPGVPGTRAAENAKGAAIKEPVTFDPKQFHKSDAGGPEVKIPHGVRAKDNRTIDRR